MWAGVTHPGQSGRDGLGGLLTEWGGILRLWGKWLGILWQVARSVIMVQDERGSVAFI